jgi:tRNA(Arg) A34 adenosine deaminase TadA
MKKSIYLSLLLGLVLIIAIYLLRSEFFRIFPSTELVTLSKRELKNTGIEALKKGDAPIAAIVLYNYSVVGRGHNTIESDTNIVGHAVINALNDAVKNMGLAQFQNSDKSSLIIMTTTEPCQMCKAVLQEYGVFRVEFMKKRSLDYWLNSYWKDIASEFKKRRLNPDDLQDSLYHINSNY